MAQENVREAEKQLKEAKFLIDRLKAAGEDVTQELGNYSLALSKLERYKKAFEVK